MENDDAEQQNRRNFAKTFAASMQGGASKKKSHAVAIVATVAAFAGGSVLIGAMLTHPKSVLTADASSSATRAHGKVGTRSGKPPEMVSRLIPTASRGGISQPGSGVPGSGVPGSAEGQLSGASQSGVSSGGTVTNGRGPAVSHGSNTAKKVASKAVRAPASPPASSGPVELTGQLNCESGANVTGVWVQAANSGDSGWASFEHAANNAGSDNNWDYWFSLSENQDVTLNIGCGGTQESWKIATSTGVIAASRIPAGHVSFNCDDKSGTADFKVCVLR